MKQLNKNIAIAFMLLLVSGTANATLISFDNVPTDTTYINDGLLLGSNTGAYTIGSCGNVTAGSNGCLGNTPNNFTGELTFTFVELGTTIQATTSFFEIILCEACAFRGSSASVFDAFGGLLTTIDMDSASGAGNRTYSFTNPGIGSIVVDLGPGADAVQSLEFGAVSSSVPEPSVFILLSLGLIGLTRVSRKTA